MNPLIQCKPTILPVLIAGVLACFELLPRAEAVMPAPDGGYPGGNTAEGQNALFSLSSGAFNTAVGWSSLSSNTTGSYNTATGAGALFVNSTGSNNTANGIGALLSNTIGSANTATGNFALATNSTGDGNTANGASALVSNTIGERNTAVGVNALAANTGGRGSTAIGFRALANATSRENTAIGTQALVSNTIGERNTAVGFLALGGNTTGSNNITLGDCAGCHLTVGDYNIDIGNFGIAGERYTIRIGTEGIQLFTYVAGIFGATVTDGVPVIVDIHGQLGTRVSSVRFKDDIKPMDKASEAILALKPVVFRYKADEKHTAQFGLIAEEVAKVNTALVLPDKEGKPYTVRYDAVNAMLLNEFLKEHKKVEEQQVTIADLKSTVAQQQQTFQSRLAEQDKQIEALASGLQKVSAQIEMGKRAPRVVANNP